MNQRSLNIHISPLNVRRIRDPQIFEDKFGNIYFKTLSKLNRYLNEYQKTRNEAASDVERYIGNPLNSYLLIKRLTLDWKEVKELVSVKTGEAVISYLTNRTEERALRWPSEEDLNGAAVALTRLQVRLSLVY